MLGAAPSQLPPRDRRRERGDEIADLLVYTAFAESTAARRGRMH
jgi:hypothetical protein